MELKKQKSLYFVVPFLLLLILLYTFHRPVLVFLGEWVVHDEMPVKSDAVVVLSTGIEVYPRLIQAADLYRKGYVDSVVINGNRKTEILIWLEEKGFQGCCPWYEASMRVLALLGVPRERIIAVSAEDVYDTVSEAEVVGSKIIKTGIQSIIISTSKSHTRRASYIWSHLFQDRLKIRTAAASSDPYSPDGWWKSGRQIRWLLAEYGAWLYYFWKRFRDRS
ncbi:YdcF family protein [Thermodesulfobacteriota bacterium]